jgi:hypothetical protein
VEVLRDAVQSVKRNWLPVAIYAGIGVVIVLAKTAGDYALLNDLVGEWSEGAKRLYNFLVDLVLVASSAILQAGVFAAIGRDIDRPLYKVDGLGEAVRRFFLPWFLLNYIFLLIGEAGAGVTGPDDPLAGLVFLLTYVHFSVFIAVGACIMFTGRFHLADILASLAPLFRQLPHTLLVFVVASLQFLLFISMVEFIFVTSENKESLSWIYFSPISCIIQAVFDCIIFSAAWRICMLDRDAEQNEDDFDF